MSWLETLSFRRAATAVAFLALLTFGGTLSHSFVWDDGYNVVHNESIRDLANVPAFFSEAWGASADEAHSRALNTNYWRPVALTSYAVDYALFGPNPAAFHATNVLLHLICSLLVLLLGWRLFPAAGPLRGAVFFSAAIFAVHPVHTEVVNVITYRTDLLAALFTAWALVLWIGPVARSVRKTQVMQWIAVPLLYFLGVASKEMAFTLPLLITCYELLVRRSTWRDLAVRLLPLGAVALGYLVIRKLLLTPSPMVYFDINWPSHVAAEGHEVALTMLSVVALYGKLLVAPWPLNPFYEWSPDVLPVQHTYLEPSVLAGAALIVGWGIVARLLLKHDRRACFLWCLLPLLLIPVSHAVPIIVAAGERFIYLGLFGPLMVATWALFNRFGSHRVLVAALSLLVLVYSAFTLTRNHDWRDDESVLLAYVADWPDSYNAWQGLRTFKLSAAKRSLRDGRDSDAKEELQVAERAAQEGRRILKNAWLREAAIHRSKGDPEVAQCISKALTEGAAPNECTSPRP